MSVNLKDLGYKGNEILMNVHTGSVGSAQEWADDADDEFLSLVHVVRAISENKRGEYTHGWVQADEFSGERLEKRIKISEKVYGKI